MKISGKSRDKTNFTFCRTQNEIFVSSNKKSCNYRTPFTGISMHEQLRIQDDMRSITTYPYKNTVREQTDSFISLHVTLQEYRQKPLN